MNLLEETLVDDEHKADDWDAENWRRKTHWRWLMWQRDGVSLCEKMMCDSIRNNSLSQSHIERNRGQLSNLNGLFPISITRDINISVKTILTKLICPASDAILILETIRNILWSSSGFSQHYPRIAGNATHLWQNFSENINCIKISSRQHLLRSIFTSILIFAWQKAGPASQSAHNSTDHSYRER
jgi:hypothetical protein